MRVAIEVPVDEDPLTLAARVYEGLAGDDIREVERLALRRQDFFEGRPGA